MTPKARAPVSRWRAIKRRLFPRGIRFTKQGKLYTVITFGVGFAAVNTGNNLLFLVLGLMLGLILVSGILSEISLRGLEVTRRVDSHVEVGIPFPVELAVKNNKRIAASFGVELRDEIDGTPFRRRCFFLRVGAEEMRSIAYRCEVEHRGRVFFDGTIISTRFPFGLFEKTRYIPLRDKTIALPASIKVHIPAPSALSGEGDHSVAVKGIGQEFRELKEMVFGDDPRRIDWRSTARLGRPMVREYDMDGAGFMEIVLDPAPRDNSKDGREEAERNISAAATIIRKVTGRGAIVRLVTPPSVSLVGHKRGDVLRLLTHLAFIDLDDAATAPHPVGEGISSVLIGPRAAASQESLRVVVPAPIEKAQVST